MDQIYSQGRQEKKLGLRASLRKQALADHCFKLASAPIDMGAGNSDTTYQAAFTEHDLTGMVIGTKKSKDRDGRPCRRDPVFLAETRILPRRMADRVARAQGDDGLAAQLGGGALACNLPHPAYNTGVTGDKCSTLGFAGQQETLKKSLATAAETGSSLAETLRGNFAATSAPKPSNVADPFFGRDSNFSMPIGDLHKRPEL